MMHFQFRLIPTLMVIPSLIIIFGLSIWQFDRLQWKEDLIDKISTRAEGVPSKLPTGIIDEETHEFNPYFVQGEFDHDKEIYLVNRSLNGNPGVHVFTPLKIKNNPQVIMINRGWVPFGQHLPDNRPQGQIEGHVQVEGLLRFPKGKNMFIPENDLVKNTWFHIDMKQMAQATGYDVAPYYIMSNDDQVPGGFPIGKQWHLNIANNHFQYAITWFLLGITLLAIFLIFSRKKQQEPKE